MKEERKTLRVQILDQAEIMNVRFELLLAAIGCLAKNPKSTEAEIFTAYYQFMIADVKKDMLHDLTVPERAETAEYALLEALPEHIETLDAIDGIPFYVPDQSPPLNYHVGAWKFFTIERFNENNINILTRAKNECADIITQIRLLNKKKPFNPNNN